MIFINLRFDLREDFFYLLIWLFFLFLLISEKLILQLRNHLLLGEWFVHTGNKLIVFGTDQFVSLMGIECKLYLENNVLDKLNLKHRTWQKGHLVILIDHIRKWIQQSNALLIRVIHKCQVINHCLNRVKITVLIQHSQSWSLTLDYLRIYEKIHQFCWGG